MPSALIETFDYDPLRRCLTVRFRTNGKSYEFIGVPEDTYQAMRAAFSKGRYFNAHIRDRYPHRVITAPRQAQLFDHA